MTIPRPSDALPLSAARLRFLAERLHALGPHGLYHFLTELRSGADFEQHLERYGRLDPQFVRSLGGDQFPDRSDARRGRLQ